MKFLHSPSKIRITFIASHNSININLAAIKRHKKKHNFHIIINTLTSGSWINKTVISIRIYKSTPESFSLSDPQQQILVPQKTFNCIL